MLRSSQVIVDYIWDPEVGPFARVKRVTVSDEEKKKLKAKGGLVQ